MYDITQNDIYLLSNRNKNLYVKLELLKKESSTSFSIVDTVEGNLVSGDYSEDADSDVRRTLSLVMVITDKSYTVGEFNRIWIDKYVRVYMGQKGPRSKYIYWYQKGVYVIDSSETTYSTEDNSITLSCSDLVVTMDGTHGGDIDATTIKIPAGSIIREAMIKTLTQLGGWGNYRVDDLGEYTCLEGIVEDYLQRRKSYPDWNQVPYDLEFDVGTTVWDIIVKLRDLYPGFECFFDEEGTFICQRIPNCEADDIVLSNEIISPLVISENSTVDMSTVRNVTRIYGASIETDRYSETCSTNDNVYTATLDSFVLSNNIVVGVKVDSNNVKNMKLRIINATGEELAEPISIVDREITTVVKTTDGEIIIDQNIPSDTEIVTTAEVHYKPCEAGKFEAGKVYCFKYASCLNTGETEKSMNWLYQGQYQIEALYKNEDESTAFCVQKIGERLQVLSGGEFDDIQTDTIAQENAAYQNWLKCRLTDTISLEMIDIPFLQTNTKIEYVPQNSDIKETYIVKKISESFMTGTSTVEMMKFYRLYPNFMGVRN